MRFYLLGHLRVEAYGADSIPPPVLPRLRKTQGLLAFLLLYHDRLHTRDHLANLFWGDATQERARDSLSTALKQVRVTLVGTELSLQADHHSVQLKFGANTWLDVDQVKAGIARGASGEERAEALRLYTADLLEGWSDEWCIEDREQLRDRVLRLGTATLHDYLAEGKWEESTALAERLLPHDPLDDTLHELMVRALLGAGDYAGARRHYQQFAAMLRNELDTDPSAALRELYGQTLQNYGPPLVQGSKSDTLARRTSHTIRGPQLPEVPQRLPFVGRKPEQQALKSALTALYPGYGSKAMVDGITLRAGLILIEGDAGIGKTRLVEETLSDAHAERPFPVIRGKASEAASKVPFGLLLAPLSHWLLEELAPAQVLQRLGPTTVATISQLLPALAVRLPGLPSLPLLPPDVAHTRLLQSMVDTLQRMEAPASPVVLFLDDLQWADADTLQVLEQLRVQFASRQNIPLLVIGTYRGEDALPDGPLVQLAERHAEDGQPVLHLHPLDREEVHHVIERRMPNVQSRLSDWLHEQSSGNAFYLSELLQGLKEDGRVIVDATVGGWRLAEGAHLPDTSGVLTLPRIAAAIISRFSKLSSDAQTLVRVAALLDETSSFTLLASSSELSEDAALSGIEDAMSRRLIRWTPQSNSYSVSHDLVREAIIKSLSPARRQRLHARIANTLEQHLGGPEAQTSELAMLMRLAFHYGETSEIDKQRYYFGRVAEIARTSFANDLAVDYYQRLIPLLTPRDQLEAMFKIAQLLVLMARRHESEVMCEQALQLALSINSIELIARARVELAKKLWLRHAYEGSFAQALSAFELIRSMEAPDPELLIQAHYIMGDTHYMLCHYSEAIDHFDHALELFGLVSDPATHCLILCRMGDIYSHLHIYDQALYFHQQALKIGQEAGDLRSAGRAMYGIGYCYNVQHDSQRAIPALLEAWRIGEQTDYRTMRTPVLSVLTTSFRRYGEYEKALACSSYYLQLAMSSNHHYSAAIALMSMGVIQASIGQPILAEECWQRSIVISRAIDDAYEQAECLISMANSRMSRGEYEEALSQTEEALRLAQRSQAIEFQCSLSLMSILLRFKLDIVKQVDALIDAEALLTTYTALWDQADILFTIWHINPLREDARLQAAAIYQRLYTERSNIEYRRRYEELTGEQLPAPAPLPDLPAFIPYPPAAISQLLAQADKLIAGMGT